MAKLFSFTIVGACVLAAAVAVPGAVSAFTDSPTDAQSAPIKVAVAAEPPAGEGSDTKSATEAKPAPTRRRGFRGYTDNPQYQEETNKLAGMRHRGEAPAAGEVAPDFELTPIKFYDFKTADRDVTKENAGVLYEPVLLSSFKGKKPVVLIFGSYT